jgi:phage terminase large subunit GpA-like protein
MMKMNDPIVLNQLIKILESSRHQISEILPSAWCEENRIMTPEISPIPGPYSYNNSPYVRELVDCLSPTHPAKRVAIMKGAQIGLSTGLIEAGIGWIISQNPGNILFLVGHEDLVKDASKKVERMIDNSGINHLIRSTSNRGNKSGNTDGIKEFPNGYLKMGIANHKVLRNISMQYGFIDDFEAMKGDTKQSGSTTAMIEQRFAAFDKKMKLFYISTPELKETSNIEPVYLQGDQRKYHVPCPCCKELICFEWETKCENDKIEHAGMHWKIDDSGRLIADSVGYICQKCGGFFDDSTKSDLIANGQWIATAEPSRPGNYSYHISALYAPPYMYGWEHYVREFIEANPPGGKRDESKHKSFVNLVLGQTYEPTGESVSANQLQKNIRDYQIGILPEKMSINDGNGKIVLLTFGSDLNGKEDDARLDYEIVAHSESGATYSIDHGSIGTFIPNQSDKQKSRVDRKKWTYQHGHAHSVWPKLDEIIGGIFKTDTGRQMKIFISGIDVGYQSVHAFQYIEKSNFNVVGLKGKDVDKYTNIHADLKTFRISRERPDLFLVETNTTKDHLNDIMQLKWNATYHEVQPSGFMNFPTPSDGKYLFTNYFSHFEAEHKVLDKDTTYRWLKKNSAVQNHLYDCRLYAMVVKDILLDKLFKELKIQNGVWNDFVNVLKGKKK